LKRQAGSPRAYRIGANGAYSAAPRAALLIFSGAIADFGLNGFS
jgi:hypothetical protein